MTPHAVLGRNGRGDEVAASLDAHTLVVGSAGSGKTVTQTSIACQAIREGYAVIAIDPVGDGDLLNELRRAAAARGREFRAWSPEGPATYDVCGQGTDREIAAKLLAADGGGMYYQEHAQRYVGWVVSMLRAAGRHVTLRAVAELMNPPALTALCNESEQDEAREIREQMTDLTVGQSADLAQARHWLLMLVESSAGHWLEPQRDVDTIELQQIVRDAGVAYFALEAPSAPLVARMLAAVLVQDLIGLSTQPTGGSQRTLVLFDEFSVAQLDSSLWLLERGRRGGLSLLLGTTELAGLDDHAGRDGMAEQVLDNVGTLIAHGHQRLDASTELLANALAAADSGELPSHRLGRGEAFVIRTGQDSCTTTVDPRYGAPGVARAATDDLDDEGTR